MPLLSLKRGRKGSTASEHDDSFIFSAGPEVPEYALDENLLQHVNTQVNCYLASGSSGGCASPLLGHESAVEETKVRHPACVEAEQCRPAVCSFGLQAVASPHAFEAAVDAEIVSEARHWILETIKQLHKTYMQGT